MSEKKLSKDVDNDTIAIISDDGGLGTGRFSAAGEWCVLVVDDDEDVHATTQFALRNVKVMGRKLNLLHAHSGVAAYDILQNRDDIAAIVLDVVMEEEHAGLKLVEKLRNEGREEVRIILRTGNPGYAPEARVIRDYDINDYHTKDELTQTRLVTALTVAIRNYHYIRTLTATRAGLQKIIDGTSSLYRDHDLKEFSNGVLTQIAALLDLEPEGAICAVGTHVVQGNGSIPPRALTILAGLGRFSDHVGSELDRVPGFNNETLTKLAGGEAGVPVFGDGWVIVSFVTREGRALLAYFEHTVDVDPNAITLLRMFSSNLSLCFENIALLNKLDELAFVDQRIHIPNQNAYMKHLKRVCEDEAADNCVAMLSIDEMAQYAVAFGPSFAEKLLLAVYTRLKDLLGGDAFIGRIGEFRLAVIHPAAEVVASTLETAFVRPFSVGISNITVTASIGLLMSTADFDGAEAADRAVRTTFLVNVKRHRNNNIQVYTSELEDGIARTIQLKSDLREAIMQSRIDFHFQPQLNMASGQIIGAETLARWNNKGENIPPSIFVPLAEKSGLCGQITYLAIKAAGAFIAKRRSLDLPLVTVSINLSFFDISRSGFIDEMLGHVSAAGLEPGIVKFEVTESSAMQGSELTLMVLERLVDLGFSLSLDDFGTGYSSLSYLDHLPVSELKIDRSFVNSLQIETARESIAASAHSIGTSLNIDVVAEGVETVEQHQMLRFIGVQKSQGYLYARPMALDEFLDWERNWDYAKVVGG